MVCIVAGFDKVVVRRSVHVDQNEWSFFCADACSFAEKNVPPLPRTKDCDTASDASTTDKLSSICPSA